MKCFLNQFNLQWELHTLAMQSEKTQAPSHSWLLDQQSGNPVLAAVKRVLSGRREEEGSSRDYHRDGRGLASRVRPSLAQGLPPVTRAERA